MLVVFVSNFMNHHMLPIAKEFVSQAEFKFIATEPINPEMLKLGYEDMNELDFVIKAYENNEKKCIKCIEDADIVIYGSCPFKYLIKRINQNKLTFKYSERIFKKGDRYKFHPYYFVNYFLRYVKFRKKELYLLSVGKFSAFDYNSIGLFKNKSFKWGYFPEVNYTLEKEKDKTLNILWCGRFIDWKHPELAVETAKYLMSKNVDFHLTFIGNGSKLQNIKYLVDSNEIKKYCSFLGGLPYKDVKKHMLKNDVFLFTSDRNEGWGAVLNEAMAAGCIPLANNAIGSTTFLIQNGYNGLTYNSNETFFSQLDFICNNRDKLLQLSQNAVLTIKNEWNEKIAVERILEFAKNKTIYKEGILGPC